MATATTTTASPTTSSVMSSYIEAEKGLVTALAAESAALSAVAALTPAKPEWDREIGMIAPYSTPAYILRLSDEQLDREAKVGPYSAARVAKLRAYKAALAVRTDAIERAKRIAGLEPAQKRVAAAMRAFHKAQKALLRSRVTNAADVAAKIEVVLGEYGEFDHKLMRGLLADLQSLATAA